MSALLDLIAIVVLGSGGYLWIAKRNLSNEARLRAARSDDDEGVPEAGAYCVSAIAQLRWFRHFFTQNR